MNTNEKGLLGEARVRYEIIKKGYDVAIPYGDFKSYDLVVWKNDKFERIQVKTVQSNTEIMNVNTFSMKKHINGKKKAVNYNSTDFEWLIVYDITTDKCFYIPSGELIGGKLALRLSPTKNNQSKKIRWAKDFEEW